jgi:hypothetical protein
VSELKKIGEPVRNFYRRQGWEEGYKAGNAILVKAVESAKVTERERIIELLKPFAEHEDDCWCGEELACYPEDCSAGVYQQVIERIKGENK